MERVTLDKEEVYRPEFTLGYFRNTFLQFFQILFASEAAPAEYKYSDDETQTKIIIQGASADNLKTVDNRPKIVVARGPARWNNRSGIGSLQADFSKEVGHYGKFVTDIVSGSVMITAVSRDYLESEIIGNHVLFLVRRFKQNLARYGLLSIGPLEASPTGMIRGADGGVLGFVTGVSVSLTAEDRWLIENDTKVLVKKIVTIVTGEPKS